MSSATDFPAPTVEPDPDHARVALAVDESIYPLAALYGASYVFIDRCYVFIDKPRPGHYRVTLSAKDGQADEAALRVLVGEFSNELLSCAWRQQITHENRATLEAVTTQALAGALGPRSLDELAAFDFTDEPLEDPLGIAVSWEEKYKKRGKSDDVPPGEGPGESEAP
jgi:His-Xaa-Ser system protein HxsD